MRMETALRIPTSSVTKRDEAIALLRAHEPELRAAGIESVLIFGSVARGEATPGSDLDLVVRVDAAFREGGFACFGRLHELNAQLRHILGCPVDVVAEPVRKQYCAHLAPEQPWQSIRAFGNVLAISMTRSIPARLGASCAMTCLR